MKCWICGEIADSREHKVKKSILKKAFSDEFEKKQMIHVKEGKESKIPGPNSNKIKYINNLCKKCNNDFTQPFDLSFDIFYDYISNNYKLLNEKRVIDFHDIYGENMENEIRNLYKYFVKIFGCELNHKGYNVPKDLIALLDKKVFKTNLILSFSIFEEVIKMDEPMKFAYGNGHMIASVKNDEIKLEENPWYKFNSFMGYLSVNMYYNCFEDDGLGSIWIANRRYTYIGSELLESRS